MNVLQAAALQKDITPALGTLINGEFQCRYANKIHDPLYAKSLILKSQETVIVFIVVDTCAMQQDFLDEVKVAIFKLTAIPKSQIMMSSTHTHSAGSITDILMGHADLVYCRLVKQVLISLVQETLLRLRPAKIAFGCVDAPEHVLCRRYRMDSSYLPSNPVTAGIDGVKTNPFGAEEYIKTHNSKPDTELAYLAVKGIDDRWISIMGNYGLHYVGDMERGTISADYFGVFSNCLRDALCRGDGFVGMMTNGTSGEINVWDFLEPDRYPSALHAKSKLIGSALANRVLSSIDNLIWETAPVLQASYDEISIEHRKPSPSELQTAKDIVRDTDYENIVLDEDGYRRVYAREQVLLAEFPDAHHFYVQSFQVGSGVIGALGGEFFAETGLSLKSAMPKGKYFTVCMANDYVGYVPPQHEIELGGYETWRCRTSRLEETAETKVKDVLLRQIEKYIR